MHSALLKQFEFFPRLCKKKLQSAHNTDKITDLLFQRAKADKYVGIMQKRTIALLTRVWLLLLFSFCFKDWCYFMNEQCDVLNS